MMKLTRRLPRTTVSILASVCLLLFLSGCPSPPDDDGSTTSASGSGSDEGEPETLIEPFDPPSFDELEASVEWDEMPVVDPHAKYAEYRASQPQETTAEEALALRHTSKEINERILDGLGRPPESDGDVNWDASITRHLPADIKSTNPLMMSSRAEFDVVGLAGLDLFSFDWEMKPFALAAYVKSWHASSDKLYDKVVMRDDMTWSDGEPVTAHDIVFSFQTIMNPRVPIPAVRSGTDQIRWIEAYDDHTFVIFHKESLATNVWNVNFPVIPKHIYEKSIKEDPTLSESDYHLKMEENPVGGGPYAIKSRQKGHEIVLQRREDWSMKDGQQVRRKPYFDEIRFRVLEDSNTSILALKSGDLDDMELEPSHWKTQTNDADFYERNTKSSGVQWVYFYFGWNCKNPLFEDERVRWAMSYAFDHREMLDELCYGLYEPCVGVFYPTAWMAPQPPPEPLKQDFDKAEALLDEAGWDDSDGDGIRDHMIGGRLVPFEFTILTSNRPLRIAICSLLKENLEQIGVICHVKPTEFTVLQQKSRDHKFQAMMAGWGTGTDPDTGENLWKTDAGRNYIQYSNVEVDGLFAKGKTEFDPEKRAVIYQQIAQTLWDEQPYTFLYFRTGFYGFNKSLRGYMYSPRGPYNYGPGFDAIWASAD